MRSRIFQYKKNCTDYDLLTQFPIKNYNSMPTFSFFNVKIKNVQTSDIQQVCLNLISIQLVGNNHVMCRNQKDVSSLALKSNGINTYFILENLSLLAYKNKLSSILLRKRIPIQNQSTISSKNFFTTIEYFALNLNFLKSLEKIPNKDLSIIFSYQIVNSKNSDIILYFLKSLGFPFS